MLDAWSYTSNTLTSRLSAAKQLICSRFDDESSSLLESVSRIPKYVETMKITIKRGGRNHYECFDCGLTINVTDTLHECPNCEATANWHEMA
jgi:rubrerythrin